LLIYKLIEELHLTASNYSSCHTKSLALNSGKFLGCWLYVVSLCGP